MRPAGDASTLEERRRSAVALLRHGRKADDVADEFGTTVRSIRRWSRTYREEGDAGLEAKPTPGRPRKLTRAEERRLLELLRHGPEASGYQSDGWGARMIRIVIASEFDVGFHKNHISRLLGRQGISVRELNVSRPWRQK